MIENPLFFQLFSGKVATKSGLEKILVKNW